MDDQRMNRHVLYLALGAYRVAAATEQVTALAAAGDSVVLVAPGTPAWDGPATALGALDGVEVVRLEPDRNGSVGKAAERLLGRRSGPLAAAEVLIAGDAQALPAAWNAQRRKPGLELRLERHETGGRTAAPADLAVLTPWYPSPNNPLAGAFVKASTAAVADRFGKVATYHTEDWSGKVDPKTNTTIMIAAERLRARPELVPVLDTPEGELTRVPVPLMHRKHYKPWVAAQTHALAKALPTGRIEAPVVHAHTGVYGGVLAMNLARPDARIVVTEHSSFLAKVFEQAGGRELYRRVLARADAFLCVSGSLRDQVAQEFPEYADKLRVVPNVIDFDLFTPGPARSPELLRWLYLGRLVEDKGVRELVEAFGRVAATEPRARLTLVGSGPLKASLLARAAELGVGARLEILPSVSHEDVNELMHQYDLLVHASRGETFGMTVVEAVAAGLPVLVARSAGPVETLAGIGSTAGALMDVSEDPQVIVDAYWRLRGAVDQLDLAAARASLEARFGRDAVAEQLMDAYLGPVTAAVPDSLPATASAAEPAPKATTTTSEPVGRAVVLALTPPAPERTAQFANELVQRGVQVTVVTARSRSLWDKAGLDPRTAFVTIEKADKGQLVPRAERFVVYSAPRRIIGKARRVAARQGSLSPEYAMTRVSRAHTKAADGFHDHLFQPVYTQARPLMLARLARRGALPGIDLSATDHVFVADNNSVATGWAWAKKYPHLTVTKRLRSDVYTGKTG
ncbi:glycosyltransferase family 4 protein [Streptacidiphilus cavernicola]|uniref:Glycosyltransferase family 4 protein n=1 Tax=Streptacidiphilus cavernicola TaxID=3342716 RepID=A0ABV6VSS8_9ACTN